MAPYLTSSYNLPLVALSLFVAIFASYVALDLARRVARAAGKEGRIWLICGSIAMGSGIWAMHFVAMMAFSLPIPLGYDWFITLLSWIAAVSVSGVALFIASTQELDPKHLILGSLTMGVGISLMHYVGMLAMRMDPSIQWNSWLFLLSIGIAVFASLAALRIFFWMRSHPPEQVLRWQIVASIVMGFAIFSMHYTGMAAAQFPVGSICRSAYGFGTNWLGYVVGMVTFGLLTATLVTSLLDAKYHDQLRISATAFEAQEGIIVTDANRNILRVNRAFTTITGYSEEEVLGKNPHLLSSGRHGPAFYAAMWNSINSTGGWEGEIWNRRKDGEAYAEHLTVTAVKDSDGHITNYVANFTDITGSLAAAEKIERLAFYDSLTHLPNRRLLIDRLQHALAHSARSHYQGALLFIDLDNFKALNDTLGHDTGDLLLQKVADRLSACVREGDTVARFGGDEFVVILEELSEQPLEAAAQAESVGEKILASLSKPYELGTHVHHSTSSIGITLFSDHDQGGEELLKQADIAMYQAKKAGRNALRFFDQQMQESINVRVDLERELRKAIDQNQFQLYYQIQVDSEGRAEGAEALIRWIHPERGLVSPAQFIPLAEDTGLIFPIGQWVLETACAQLKAWQQNARTRDLVLAINVSAKQFRQIGFVDQVIATMQRHAISPQRLKLELTESMLLENVEDTITTMHALNEAGVRFSLDDFGTGYSSLQYLKRLPLARLKIDQSFVRDITFDAQDRAIVSTIIAMASSLGLNVIAEGVETEEQRQLLIDKGCNHFQGYLFGKPVPVDAFEARLNLD